MAKGRFKNVLATSLAITGAIQLGASTPANAMVTLKGGGVNSENSNVISAEDARAAAEKHRDKEHGTKIAWCKGDTNNGIKMRDPHREIHEDDTGRQFSRYTEDDGTPFTGLYKSVIDNGNGVEWYVLDEDGFCGRDEMKPHYVWVDGMLCADFVEFDGPNYNKLEDCYYLGTTGHKEDTRIMYVKMNDWKNEKGKWYRSNDKGICYRNQWFKDESNGDWYYFNDKCEMVTSTLVNGYWVDENGICKM